MSSFAQLVALCVTMAIGVVLAQNLPLPRGVQPFRVGSDFVCPNQEVGSYEYQQGDCEKFYFCFGGVSSLIVCKPQMLFNRQKGYCDFPSEALSQNCQNQDSKLPPEVRNICRQNPGIPEQAFHVPHPDICNAFYTCSLNYLHDYCTFCGEYEFFSQESGGCRNYLELGQDLNTICQGRRYVEHKDKVFEQLRSCYPYNPLIVPGQSTVAPQRPG